MEIWREFCRMVFDPLQCRRHVLNGAFQETKSTPPCYWQIGDQAILDS